jgi:hypothetical protein
MIKTLDLNALASSHAQNIIYTFSNVPIDGIGRRDTYPGLKHIVSAKQQFSE